MAEPLISIQEASKYLGLSRSFLYHLTAKNQGQNSEGLPFYRVASRILFRRSEVDLWLLSRHSGNGSGESEKAALEGGPRKGNDNETIPQIETGING